MASIGSATRLARNRMGSTDNLNAVAYGNGQFVVVADFDIVLSSTDGVNWVQTRS
jgi:hypothetical protein